MKRQLFAVLIAVVACTCRSQTPPAVEAPRPPAPVAPARETTPAPAGATAPTISPAMVGWFNGACVAITSASPAPGDAVTLIVLGDHQAVLTAVIEGPASADSPCPPLTGEGRDANAASGASFFAMKLPEGVKPTSSGIAILGARESRTTKEADGLVRLDITGDGTPEAFSMCLTSEGVRYSAWSGKPGEGEPAWTGYEALGYDVTPTCP